MSNLQFVIDGPPHGKARPRITRSGHAYTPENTRKYEKLIRDIASLAAYSQGWKITDEAVAVSICARFPIPESWTKIKKQKALSGELHPVKKPDSDNITKAVLDAMNGIVYKDDVQVIDIRVIKQYCTTGQRPGVDVEIKPVITKGA